MSAPAPRFTAATRTALVQIAVFAVLVALLPFVLRGYHLSIATTTLLLAGLALSWNVIGGIGGQFSLGHSLFIAAGALLPAAFGIHHGLNPWAGLVIAAALSAVLGALIAWISFRFDLPKLTFALITLAVAEIGLILVLNIRYLGAADGLMIRRDSGLGIAGFNFSARGSYWLALAGVVAGLVIVLWVLHSRLGYYLRAVHIDDRMAQATGIDTLRTKATGMALSAAMTSVFATMYAQYMIYVDPHAFASPILVIQIVLFCSIGGLGTLWGPVLAAALLVPVGEIARGLLGGTASGMHFVIYGVLIVIIILFMPDGLAGGLTRVRARLVRLSRRTVSER